MAGVLPVVEVDGRRIGTGGRGPVTARLQTGYAALVDREAAGGREAALPGDADGPALKL
jgi:branched-chain amino acid aminotransferase